ncbi:hypothetical protein KY284_030107 [Solanum tuberosum]|nr:hypothetical protein KY284_030107 [Solanum tuberosum]
MEKVVNKMFGGWQFLTNLNHTIMAEVELVESSAQMSTCMCYTLKIELEETLSLDRKYQIFKIVLMNIVTVASEDREAFLEVQQKLQTDPRNKSLHEEERPNVTSTCTLPIWLRAFSNNKAITQVRDDQGEWQYDQESIATIFVRLYEELLGKEDATKEETYSGFTERDVKETMFKIDCTKIPGPDGYGSGFFISTWKVVGKDITEAILEFFKNGKLLSQINVTNIALIPKVVVPEFASQGICKGSIAGIWFPSRFTELFMTCITSPMFTVKDTEVYKLSDFQFHPMCKNVKLTYLIFADHLMIFCKWVVQSAS